MIPSARRHPNSISQATAIQTVEAATPVPSKAGLSTSLVACAIATVRAIDATANRIAPASEAKNGLGCSLM